MKISTDHVFAYISASSGSLPRTCSPGSASVGVQASQWRAQDTLDVAEQHGRPRVEAELVVDAGVAQRPLDDRVVGQHLADVGRYLLLRRGRDVNRSNGEPLHGAQEARVHPAGKDGVITGPGARQQLLYLAGFLPRQGRVERGADA